ncbi:MAG: hypothetical protein V3U29_10720 [Phycisphaeraceae bacterium]
MTMQLEAWGSRLRMPFSTPASSLLLIAVLAAVSGCGYRLRGTVLEGTTPAVLLVENDDPRLSEPGLGGAVLTLTLDPDRLSAKHLGSHQTNVNGQFDVPINEMGAGFLEYDVGLLCRLAGHRAVQHHMRLPGSNKRLLIIMAQGKDMYKPKPDILGETMRFHEQMR